MKTILKIFTLSVLFMVSAIGLICVPDDSLSAQTWAFVLVTSKAISAVFGYIGYRLLKHWATKEVLSEFDTYITD